MKTDDHITCREFRETDFPEINRIWEETAMGGKARNDNLETIHNTLRLGGKLILIENTHKEIIGTSWLTNDGRRLYMHHFAIRPEYQGKGYARILLEQSLQIAQEKGLQIKLEVHRNNWIAKELYIKAGFKYLGDYLVYIIRDVDKIKPGY